MKIPEEIIAYIYEFVNMEYVMLELEHINWCMAEVYYQEYITTGRRLKEYFHRKEKIFRKLQSRLLIFNKFSQINSKYYVICKKGLSALNSEDRELLLLKIKKSKIS